MNGENGIIKCLDQRYTIIAFPSHNSLAFLDMNGKIKKEINNSDEMVFK